MNKKKHFLFTMFLLACTAALLAVSCGDEETPGYVPETIPNPVTGIRIDNVSADGIVLADIGDTETVQVSVNPSNGGDAERYHFSYTSSDQRIFTVSDDGLLTATGAGVAYLSVIPNNNAELAVKCPVTVVGVRVTEIVIADGYRERTLVRTNAAGPSFELAAQVTVVPADASIKTLKYTSSDPSVATVSEDGTVTAIWTGTTTVRVEATDRSGVFAESVITVNITPITSIAFTVPANSTPYYQYHLNDRDNRNYNHGGPSNEAQLSANESPLTKGTSTSSHVRYLPANATRNTLEYSSLHPAIVTVESNESNQMIINPVSAGTATVRASATDGSGVFGEQTLYIHHMLDQTNWKVVDASAYGTKTGSGTGDTQVAYWAIEEALHGGVGTLLKPSAPMPEQDVAGTPLPNRTDSAYFVIDMQAPTSFDYFSVQWNRSMDNGSRLRYFALHGSNDNVNWSFLQRVDKGSNWQYRTVLNQKYTYRYLKVKVINAASYNYTGGSGNPGIKYWHICNLNFGVLP